MNLNCISQGHFSKIKCVEMKPGQVEVVCNGGQHMRITFMLKVFLAEVLLSGNALDGV